MKHMLLIAGGLAIGLVSPGAAKPGHGHGNPHGYGYGIGGCPPGLAKKHNGCMPPGQAKKLNRGDRWQSSYGSSYSYNRIPYDLRRRYALNSRYRYYYSSGTIYAVNPRTMMIAQVISALVR